MGVYINPPIEEFGPLPKESWVIRQIMLHKTATEISKEEFVNSSFDKANAQDKVYLAMINNGTFTALLVMHDEREHSYVKKMIQTDTRQIWFLLADYKTAMEYAS